MMEFVSWDAEIPKIWKNKRPVPHHHPLVNMIAKPTEKYGCYNGRKMCFFQTWGDFR
jgi:hypothetical protein